VVEIASTISLAAVTSTINEERLLLLNDEAVLPDLEAHDVERSEPEALKEL
jgi:hypothetical protein